GRSSNRARPARGPVRYYCPTGVSHPPPAAGRRVCFRASARALPDEPQSLRLELRRPFEIRSTSPGRTPELVSRERLGMWIPLTSTLLVGTLSRIHRPSRCFGSIRSGPDSGGIPRMYRLAQRSLLALAAALAILGLVAPAHAQTKPAAAAAAAPAAANTGRITGRALEKGKDPVPFAN